SIRVLFAMRSEPSALPSTLTAETYGNEGVTRRCRPRRAGVGIGTSSKHNAISHLKIVIVDGVYTDTAAHRR
ncbi:MAG: hypothetical protein J2P28_04440, partial [Actinobacteria bacterium]|nr:hypothetical protein [Actinomycetota bacterium]